MKKSEEFVGMDTMTESPVTEIGQVVWSENAIALTVLGSARQVRGSRMTVLIVMCICGFFGTSTTIAFGITASRLASALNLSVVESALLSSSPLLSAAVLAVPIALLTRSYGGRFVVWASLSITGAAILVLAACLQWAGHVLPTLYPLIVILGLLIGTALVNVVAAIIHCSWWFPLHQHGTMVGCFLFSVSLGPAAFGAFADPAIEALTIAGFYLFWGLLLVAAGLLSLFFGHNPPYIQLEHILRRSGAKVETLPGTSSRNLVPLHASNVTQAEIVKACHVLFNQEVHPTTAFLRDLRISLTSLTSWMVIVCAAFSLGSLLGLVVWIPTFFLEVFMAETTTEIVGFIVMGHAFASALGCFCGGFLADRLNPWAVSATFIILSILCFLCLGLSTVYGLSITASIVAGFACAATNVSAYKLSSMLCGDSSAGTTGWMEAGGNLMSFAVPLLQGVIASAGPNVGDLLRVGMAIPAGLMLGCLLSWSILLIRSKTRK